eukprot:11084006-Karenia_brevis.AAC.1
MEEDEEDVELPDGVETRRIALPKEEEFLKKIGDPRMPGQEEIRHHYEMGHTNCRSWCDICVRARAKEREIVEEMMEKRESCQSIHGITVSLEMRQAIDGGFW